MPIQLTAVQWKRVHDALSRVRGEDGFSSDELIAAMDYAVGVIVDYVTLLAVLDGRLGVDVVDGVAHAVLV